MAEFEEKLNAILGDQQAMGQIMALARSLSGGGEQTQQVDQPAPETEPQSAPLPAGLQIPHPPAAAPMPDLSALLGQMDPGMLQMGMRLFREYQGNDDRNTALLAALRPFLREERRARLDRAMEIARVTRLIRVALGSMGGKGEGGGV